jgi:preprotein translocase subunit SecY
MNELARRIAVTIGLLLVYRLGAHIPIPGIDLAVARGASNTGAGGIIARLSILALGLAPYVSAAVLIQVVAVVFSGLKNLERRGEHGRRAMLRLTLALAFVLATIQGFGIATALSRIDNLVTVPGPLFIVTTTLTLAAGSLLLAWFAELITRYGIGNGIALILFIGLAGGTLSAAASALELNNLGVIQPDTLLGLAALTAGLVFSVAAVERARLLLPLKFAGKRLGEREIAAQDGALSFKVNNAGILPALVAPWFFYLPLSFFASLVGAEQPWLRALASQMQVGQPGHMIFNTVVIVILAFVYTANTADPDHIAARLKSYDGVIPGVEPGEATADAIDRAVSRTTMLGAVYLALVYLIPELLVAYMRLPFFLGGVSALIAVGVVLDIDAQVRGLTSPKHAGG